MCTNRLISAVLKVALRFNIPVVICAIFPTSSVAQNLALKISSKNDRNT